MARHLYPNFLNCEVEYAAAERFWIDLWKRIQTDARDRNEWRQPWFQPLPPSISQGNPIFSAVSPRLKRGIRIIQSEPTEKELEFVAYPDTFGASMFDPGAIRELVISCALSDEAALLALSLMQRWVEGERISFDLSEAGLVMATDPVARPVHANRLVIDESTVVLNGGITDESMHMGLRLPAA